MSEQHPLPIVDENDLLLMMADDAIDGQEDPNHKEWFRRFAEYNPILAGELIHRIAEEAGGNLEKFDVILKIAALTIHSLEIAGLRAISSEQS